MSLRESVSEIYEEKQSKIKQNVSEKMFQCTLMTMWHHRHHHYDNHCHHVSAITATTATANHTLNTAFIQPMFRHIFIDMISMICTQSLISFPFIDHIFFRLCRSLRDNCMCSYAQTFYYHTVTCFSFEQYMLSIFCFDSTAFWFLGCFIVNTSIKKIHICWECSFCST